MPLIDQIPCYKDDAFQNTGDTDAPPDTGKAKWCLCKNKKQRNTHTCQQDAFGGRRQSVAKPPEGTCCCDFCTHKELRKAHDPEIINADRKNSIIIQENLKNRSRQENEQQCAK